MLTVENGSFSVLEIKKSKFISIAFGISSLDEAKNKLDEIRKNYADASHICYAYKVGGQEKFFDDGEPSGTAGKRILSIISIKNLRNVLIVVIRYFGGIKLGAGPLSRAYQKSANLAIEFSKVKEIEKMIKISFCVNEELKYKVYLLSLGEKTNLISTGECCFLIECKEENENNILEKLRSLDAKIFSVKEELR